MAGSCLFSLFNGTCASYCYDLNNRLTRASELSLVLVMLGLNFGVALVPYAVTQLWHLTRTPWPLMWLCLGTNVLPLLLM